MSTLHLITKEPDVEQLTMLLAEKDEIVLLSEGVYHIVSLTDSLNRKGLSNRIYVMNTDFALRGLQNIEANKLIQYQELVELTLSAERSITW